MLESESLVGSLNISSYLIYSNGKIENNAHINTLRESCVTLGLQLCLNRNLAYGILGVLLEPDGFNSRKSFFLGIYINK